MEQLRKAALHHALLQGPRRKALRLVSGELALLGARGVVLKGAAQDFGRRPTKDDGRPRRVALIARGYGDIDIYVPARCAARLHGRLRAAGAVGSEARAVGGDHLPVLQCEGVRIELHQVIGRAHLSVPASELLAAARPLGAPGCDQLDVLSSEGQLLHAALHCTQHHFYFGLKTSWDLLWICERDPALDWDRLQRWVGLCASPLAFAVPVAVLQRDLQLLLPPPLLKMVQAATATASGSGSALALRRRGVVVRIAQRNWCAAPESYPGDGLARYAIRLVPPLRPVARLLATGWLVGRCGHHLAAGATRGRLFTGGCEQNTTAATLAQRSLWSVSKVAVGRLYRLWVPQANAPQAVAATAPDE